MSRVRSSTALLAVLLGTFFLSLYLLTGSSDLQHNGDTLLRFQTTQALVDHGRLWIENPVALDARVQPGIGGHLYAFYGPGQSLLMAPLYLGGKAVSWVMSIDTGTTALYSSRSLDLILGALLAVLFFFFALSAGYSTTIAVILTLIFGAATAAWPDAQSGLEQTQVNLFLLGAVVALWRFIRSGMESRRWLALVAFAAGSALLTRYDAVLYLPVFAAFIAVVRWRKGQSRRVAGDSLVYGLALAPFIGGVALWNLLRFGSPLQTGLHEQTFWNPPWLGLAELLVSPGKGLLWYVPLVLLLPWAVRGFYRRQSVLATLCATMAAIPLLFYANIIYWHGDPSWGPRYLFVAVPYLILPLGELLASWQTRPALLRTFFICAVGTGLILSVAAVSVTQWRYWYRLEAMEQTTSQPFRWGATHYHYYWVPMQSPILIQLDNVYQVARIQFGESRYREVIQPDQYVSNPAVLYPVNTFAFWWSDVRHPVLSQGARAGIASSLGLIALASLALLLAVVGSRPQLPLALPDRRLSQAGTAGG